MFWAMSRKNDRGNVFSLKLYTGSKDADYLRSDEYPSVNVLLDVKNPRTIMKELKDVPEQHLAAIGAISDDDDFTEGHKGLCCTRATFNAESGVSIPVESAIGIASINKLKRSKFDFDQGDILTHEVGHGILNKHIGKKRLFDGDVSSKELLADRFMSEYTGARARYEPSSAEEEIIAEDILGYATTLQEEKNPSIGELKKYANKSSFSFLNRRGKGFYPADSNLTYEYFDTVRRIVYNKLMNDVNYTDPNDERQIVRLTGDVCKELDSLWNPAWGNRPTGNYIKVDVQEAWEELD